MGDDVVNRIDLAEFRRLGYLQEVNCCFFHPLGLALEVVTEDDGTTTLGGVWDYRDDPEGMIFDVENLSVENAKRIEGERQAKVEARRRFGCDDSGVQSLLRTSKE